MRRRLIPERLRWHLARALNRLPSQCWADLVCWVLGDDRWLPWSPIGDVCRRDRAATGCCWCGKLGDRPEGRPVRRARSLAPHHHPHRTGGIVTTPPRPTLDETIARIDAVLAEPEPSPLAFAPLVAVMRQRDDRIGQLLREGSWRPPSFSKLLRAYVRARR